ncbi:MAG: LysR family transcriptional regulator [Gammaproteobacteria bacterium]|nr:LysR family transcriptional regulator [Gammaproteobacteria bacterium]
MKAKITLEQWQTLIHVVESGGYAQAAEAMDKSQSAVSYAIQKLETQLSLRAFKLEGRRAVLTPVGQTLYKRAKHLVDDALQLEEAGEKLAAGVEPQVTIAVDTLFPNNRLLTAIETVSSQFPSTQFELRESTLSGPNEDLLSGKANLAITAYAPPGLLGETIADVELRAVAASHHPLHQLGRTLSWDDLRKHRQIVVRDTGVNNNRDAGWLGAEQRLTVTSGITAIRALERGLGFAWVPCYYYQQASGLEPLKLREGSSRKVHLQLIYADRDYAGPATTALASALMSS